MDFVAIDFETASSAATSICSMGICVVENNIVTETKEILVKPYPFQFNDYNTYIHGIMPEEVFYEPTFDKLWNGIKPYLDKRLVVAHNSTFDIGALRQTLLHYNIEYPSFDYICTVKLSQKAYPELPSHKLNNLAEALGITFSHHQAGEDAYACAMVLIRILEDFDLVNLNDVEKKFEIGVGRLYPGYHEPFSKNKKKQKMKKDEDLK